MTMPYLQRYHGNLSLMSRLSGLKNVNSNNFSVASKARNAKATFKAK